MLAPIIDRPMAMICVKRIFEEVGKPGTDLSSPPPFEEEDIEKFLGLAPRYGAEILSPEP